MGLLVARVLLQLLRAVAAVEHATVRGRDRRLAGSPLCGGDARAHGRCDRRVAGTAGRALGRGLGAARVVARRRHHAARIADSRRPRDRADLDHAAADDFGGAPHADVRQSPKHRSRLQDPGCEPPCTWRSRAPNTRRISKSPRVPGHRGARRDYPACGQPAWSTGCRSAAARRSVSSSIAPPFRTMSYPASTRAARRPILPGAGDSLIEGRGFTEPTGGSPRRGPRRRATGAHGVAERKRYRSSFQDSVSPTAMGDDCRRRRPHQARRVHDGRPQVYWSYLQRAQDRMALVVRTDGDPAALVRVRSLPRSAPRIPSRRSTTCGPWPRLSIGRPGSSG